MEKMVSYPHVLYYSLDERLETIKQLDNQILEYLSTQSEIEKEIESAALFKEPVYEVIVKIEKALSFCEHERKKKEIEEQAGSGALSNANQPAVVVSTGMKSRLPKLTIKKFSGQPSGWQEFWNNFSLSVHENSGLNDVDRFVHLRSLVEGTAYDTIAGRALTAADYKVTVDLLKQRSGQRQLITNCHMENLMKITPLNSSADIKRVRQLYDNI